MKFNVASLTCPRCNQKADVDATVVIDPGVHTFSNGDPGYPGSTEVEMIADTCSECGAKWTDDEIDALSDLAAMTEPPDQGDDEPDFS